jgi:Xaa-Pro aminopeptidase
MPPQGESSATLDPLQFLKRSTAFLFFEDVKPSISELRRVKDAGEIALLRKAVDASIAAHIAAMKALKPNVSEYQISALWQYEWGKRGCERPSYPPIVGSGHNSTVLHYSDNTATMKGGDVVVIDAAAECSMYAADLTRTLPVSGHFSAREREIYDIVLGAQQAAIDAFQSGKSLLFGDSDVSLTKVAKDYIRAHGKDLHGQTLDQYFTHGIGHYIGLDVHDAGDYKTPLGPGMTFTIEPGIYIPEENIGVRIEDDFLVGADGKLVKLSAALPSKAEDVERVMAGK